MTSVPFDVAIRDVSSRAGKLPKRDWRTEGLFPIIDQGKGRIAGYSDDAAAVYSGELPVIVFGDHTRRLKFVEQPFIKGADGVKVFAPRGDFDARFLYWFLHSADIPSAGYSRHFKFLKPLQVPIVPIEEQRRIVERLDVADRVLEAAEAACALCDDLTLADFEATFGRPGTWPWEQAKVKDVGRVQLGRQRAPRYQTGLYTRPYMRVANVFEDRIDLDDVLSMDFEPADFEAYELRDGDILLNEGQSIELVGRPAMWRGELEGCCFQNTLLRFQADLAVVEPEFALAVFRIYLRYGEFARISSRTSNVAHLGASRFANMPFPLPPREDQRAFADRRVAYFAQKQRSEQRRQMATALRASLVAEAFGDLA